MAIFAMVMSSVFGCVLSGVGLLSDDLAQRVEKLTFLITTMISLWGGIIAGYFGTKAWVMTKTKKGG